MSLVIFRASNLPAAVKTRLSFLVAAVAVASFPSSAFAQNPPPAEGVEALPPAAAPAAAPPAAVTAAPADGEESPPSAERRQYVRHGFTMELGLGISETAVTSDVEGREHSQIGLAPLSIGLGGFLSPRLAIIARAAGTSTFRDDSQGKSYQTVNGFY